MEEYDNVEFDTPEQKAAFLKWVEDLRGITSDYAQWQTEDFELRVRHDTIIARGDAFRVTPFIDGIDVNWGDWSRKLTPEDLQRLASFGYMI